MILLIHGMTWDPNQSPPMWGVLRAGTSGLRWDGLIGLLEQAAHRFGA